MRRLTGAKHRNLTKRGGVYYYQRVVNGKRIRFSCETGDLEEAQAVRDTYEARRRIGTRHPIIVECPRFAKLAGQYLETEERRAKSDGEGLAPTTLEDKNSHLREDGPILPLLGRFRVDEIRRAHIVQWWEDVVERPERAYNTGLNWLTTISRVLVFGMDRDLIEVNPAEAFRKTLGYRRRTKQGRAALERQRKRHPIESVDDVRAFVQASARAGRLRFANGRRQMQRQRGHVADMLMLDAGLRPGEVSGLRWRDVHYGASPDDPERCLHVVESIARGRHEGRPKSGRGRAVPLSRRLRKLLREHWIAEGQPPAEARVVPGGAAANYRARHFQDVLERAELAGQGYMPKDLRATFATQLVRAGCSFREVGDLLGHADGGETARAHYVEYERGRVPLERHQDELAVDLLERVTDRRVTPLVTPAAREGS